MKTLSVLIGVTFALSSVSAFCGEDLDVLPPEIGGVPTSDMTRAYLLNKAQDAWVAWKEADNKVRSREELEARQKKLRTHFVEMLGGFPERTSLNPRITGILERPGYRVEKVIFESQPMHFVSAALFLPESAAYVPPYPGVLVPCGHAENAKAYETYQSMGAFLALTGMVALVFDPIEQGERMQLLDDNGRHTMWGTRAHTMVGVGCTLLGRNTARFEIWDGMRGIDYLQSRPEVAPARIGCTGNSGGGTQTSFLMALDDRIQAAAPSCYLSKVVRQLETATGDAEQNIYGQLAWGLEHAELMTLRAPMPLLICAATEDFFDIHATWESYRHAKARFTLLGVPERIDLLENDAKHNYNTLQRQGAVRWLARWLLGRDEALVEPPLELFTDEELHCTPEGQVMLLEGARSTYDLNVDYERELAPKRKALWEHTPTAKMLTKVRALAGVRPLAEIPPPAVEELGQINGKNGTIRKLTLSPEPGIVLPALLFQPKDAGGKRGVLYLNERGKSADDSAIARLVKEGNIVLAVDVRGTGETQQTAQGKFGAQLGSDWEDYYVAYVLGLSYVGMRAEDILVCGRWLGETASKGIELQAVGNVGVPALHAAALEPQLFERVHLEGVLRSWSDVVHTRPTKNQLINTIHGALTVYDLPDLAAVLGEKLSIERPVDAMGRELS